MIAELAVAAPDVATSHDATAGAPPCETARAEALVRAALTAAKDEGANALERADMLMELAMGLQQRPKAVEDLTAATELYDAALAVCPTDERLLRARIIARKGTALQAIPEPGTASVERARTAYEAAIPVLAELGGPEELAEAEMNLGLALQHLAGAGRARMADAIAAYQRSLRTFNRRRFPVEFAILQNNLATAFLAIPFTDEQSKMREALAVQAFEEGLKAVNLIDHPTEYAMLQNNLGNALQYASSSHAIANNLRAIEAYDEALRVRTRDTTPVEYANTIANKANCLWNMPDEPERPEKGNPGNLAKAKAYYDEARELFALHGEIEKARLVTEAAVQIEQEFTSAG
jgi:tetratricopeptide (TPR) repeat protein